MCDAIFLAGYSEHAYNWRLMAKGASRDPMPTGRVTCPTCLSRLDVFETPSGGRAVSTAYPSAAIEPKSSQEFVPPDVWALA